MQGRSRVYATPEVIEDLQRLIDVLYEKEYFSFEEASISYVVELFEDIVAHLPYRRHKPAPRFFTDRYGKELYYAAFPKSKRTTWYVFFVAYRQNSETIYQVRYITNSHVAAQHL